MRVLIVKTSSMGDLIHTLPAVTDAKKAISDIQFDWVSEEGFAEIPHWHPAVDKVIPIAIRRWRKNIFQTLRTNAVCSAINQIKETEYDYIIDAQGLVKSAIVARLAKGLRCGMDRHSCREPLASLMYQKKIAVSRELHAIDRVRKLFADALEYSYEMDSLEYGLNKEDFKLGKYQQPYLVFLHGSSRKSKLWRIDEWIKLSILVEEAGYKVYLPWGNDEEHQFADKISANCNNSIVLSKMQLGEIAGLLAKASGVVGVDTGLAHLTAALNIPAVTLYVDTYPSLTGACGLNQTCLSQKNNAGNKIQMTCLETHYYKMITAHDVWQRLKNKI